MGLRPRKALSAVVVASIGAMLPLSLGCGLASDYSRLSLGNDAAAADVETEEDLGGGAGTGGGGWGGAGGLVVGTGGMGTGGAGTGGAGTGGAGTGGAGTGGAGTGGMGTGGAGTGGMGTGGAGTGGAGTGGMGTGGAGTGGMGTGGMVAGTGGQAPAGGPMLHYMFDELTGLTIGDATGGGRNGTLSGGGTFGPGRVGYALTLNGTNGFVDLPDGLFSTAGELTVSVWVYVQTARNWQRIFDFGNNTTVNMFLTTQVSSSMGVRFAITTGGGSPSAEQRLTGPALPLTTWKHVAVVLGPAGGALYIDGARVATNASLTLRPADLGAIADHWLGRSHYAADPYFAGALDQLRFYTRALSDAEIAALHAQP